MRKTDGWHYILLLCLVGVLSLSSIPAFAELSFERMWPRREQHWDFYEPHDVAIGPGGQIFVTDTWNHSIKVFEADGSFIRTWGSKGDAEGQFGFPYGIAVDSKGRVYVADTANYRIQVFESDGTFIQAWGTEGTGERQFKEPWAIALDSADHVYVVDRVTHRIQVFESDGSFVRAWGGEGNREGRFNEPRGIAVDSADRIYVVDAKNYRIQVFTSDGSFADTWGREGSDDGQFGSSDDPTDEFDGPKGIAVDSADRVYVVDSWNSRIQVFESDGSFIQAFRSSRSAEEPFYDHWGIAVDAAGRVYVTGTFRNNILVFESDGRFVQTWESRGSVEGQLDGPWGIALDGAERVYVADTGNHRIQVFKSDGGFVRTWGTEGSGEEQLLYPMGVAADRIGQIYVADTYNNRIQIFKSDGSFVGGWGSRGGGESQFNDPEGIAVDDAGRVYVADTWNHRIQVFEADGTFVRVWGSKGSATRQFNLPSGISVDNRGLVYVADTYNNRIQVFEADGSFIREWGELGSAERQFEGPIGIAIEEVLDGQKFVHVVDSFNHRIQVFALDGRFLYAWGGVGNGVGQFARPAGIAIGASGSMFFLEAVNNRIQKFSEADSRKRKPKAIIVAGSGPYSRNAIWDETEILAHRAHRALGAQGLLKEQVRYLTAGNAQQDLDNNGQFDDLLPANLSTLRDSLTDWALDAESVVLYLVGHAAPGRFALNHDRDPSETLASADLGAMVKDLQAAIPGRVVTIVDACHSGSFLSDLAAGRSIALASAGPTELAQIHQGGRGFSYYFWTEVLHGNDLGAAFELATDGVADLAPSGYPQKPQAEANGDVSFTREDLRVLKDICLGNCIGYAGLFPELIKRMDDLTLNGETSTRLWARAESLYPLLSVTATVLRPDYRPAGENEPITDLPEVALAYNPDTGAWEGRYRGFDVTGDYLVSFSAKDDQYQLSLPLTATVTQTQSINACSGASNTWVQKAYIAYYGRPADPEGLDYWACRMDGEGGDLASIIQAFGVSEEYAQRFGGLTSEQLITNIYRNLFNRDPDPAGFAWYRARYESGEMSLQTIALDVLTGAQNLDEVMVSNKLTAAYYFTEKVRDGCAYGSTEAALDLLRRVNASQSSVDDVQTDISEYCGL